MRISISFILAFLAFSMLRVAAQSLSPTVVASGGADLTVTDWALSSTIGEAAITTQRGSNYVLTQGFQQGPVILLSTRKDYFPDLDIRVFPNPASSYVTVTINGQTANHFKVQVFDMYGRLMWIDPPELLFGDGYNLRLNLSPLAKGNYLIRITDSENKWIYSDIKIVKIR